MFFERKEVSPVYFTLSSDKRGKRSDLPYSINCPQEGRVSMIIRTHI